MKITVVISSMGPGGAERVVSHLCGFWADTGRQVFLVTLSKGPSFYQLNEGVQFVNLDLMTMAKSKLEGAWNNIRRIRRLRNEIERIGPDVIISFMDKTNVLVLLATAGLDVPVIVSERTFPGSYNIGFGWSLLRKLSYKRAFRVVAVTEDMKTELARRGIRNVTVVPNPVIGPPGQSNNTVDFSGPKILLAAGRLEHLKGFDVLIQAFSKIHQNHQNWVLVIAGSGELEHELKQLASRSGVADSVRFPGTIPRFSEYLEQIEAFVLSSRFEGFPNVLVEAMAAGKAVVAADCHSGPREIVTDTVDGLLVAVEDVDLLARTLDSVMADQGLRQRLGENARNKSRRYTLPKVMERWDHLVEEAAPFH